MQPTTDFDAAQVARSLLRRSRQGALATLMAGSGDPYCSLVNVASHADGSPILLISRLALHTRNILADARVSLMLDERAEGDPLEGSRIMLAGRAERGQRRSSRDCCAAAISTPIRRRKPLWILRIFRFSGFGRPALHLVAGFGRIVDLDAGAVSDRHFRCRRAAGGRARRRRAHECRSSRRDEPLRDAAARRRRPPTGAAPAAIPTASTCRPARQRCGWIFRGGSSLLPHCGRC